MKRGLIRIGKALAAGALILVVSASILILLVIHWPSIIFNTANIERAAEYARRFGIDLYWKDLDASATPIGAYRSRLSLSFERLCIAGPEAPVRGCFATARVVAIVNFSSWPPRISVLGPVRLKGGSFQWAPEEPQAGASGQVPRAGGEGAGLPWGLPELPSWVRGARLRNIEVEVSSLRLRMVHEPVDLSFRVVSADPTGDDRLPWEFDVSVSGKLPAGNIGQVGGRLTLAEFGRGSGLSGRLNGRIERAFVQIFSEDSEEIPPWLRGLELRECWINLQGTEAAGKLLLECPMKLDMRLPSLKTLTRFELPSEISFKLSANLTVPISLSFSFPLEPSIHGTVDLDLEPIQTDVLRTELDLSARIEGGRVASEVLVDMWVPRFEDLKRLLRESPWAVPAPWNVLKGNVRVASRGEVILAGGARTSLSVMLPFRVESELTSMFQNFNIEGDGKFTWSIPLQEEGPSSALLRADVALDNVKLALPRFNLASAPRFFPDPRIHEQAKAEDPSRADVFTYDIRVRTAKGGPLKLIAGQAKEPVPIQLDLRFARDQPLEGRIKLLEFPLEVLKRKAVLEYASLDLAPRVDESPVSGSVRIEYVDYDVRVLLLGTVGEPQIQLVSEPPLPEADLLSVLLYGRPREELDPEQESSLVSARAAIAERAIGLFSIYVLASTPFESVGYNPETGTFSAKVRLAEGTSLTLGTETGEAGVLGFRKRLGSNWAIRTELLSPFERGRQTISTFLEWSKRY